MTLHSLVAPTGGQSDDVTSDLRTERIFELSEQFNATIGGKIDEIASINRLARMLALNAMVVAARAGEAGKGFSLVAEEFKTLSTQIDGAIGSLELRARTELETLTKTSGAILERLRRQRLTDLALNAIEIIDRNLYERTCDVRWWATDSAVVACAEQPSREASSYASRRLKVILDAYTVYLDLWICDASGQVIASGRPDRYPGAKDHSVARERWFEHAMRLTSGDDFVAGDVEMSHVLGDAPIATYATAIRQGAAAKGKAIGVLGVHFDWSPQAQAVVNGVRLSEDERNGSTVMILDQNHRILASSTGQADFGKAFGLKTDAGRMGAYIDGDATVGYAHTPGYETYKGMGWYGCVMQKKRS